MARRGGTVPGLRVRVSHEATRLSTAHVAAAFEQLVPVLERQTRQPCSEGDKHGAGAMPEGAEPMTDPVANRHMTTSPAPRAGARRK